MKIFLACDHGGFELKEEIKKFIESEGIKAEDKGAYIYNPEDDYPDFVIPAINSLTEDDLAILLCKNGVGVCMLANKFPQIRAALSWNPHHAATTRTDDNSNVLCLPADYIDIKTAKDTVAAWLGTDFSGAQRHIRRLNKIRKATQQ